MALKSYTSVMPTNKKTIYLARHAKSSWNSDAKNDFDRPLSKRGLKDANRIGLKLRSLDCQPDAIIASPAQRARQTCQILSEYIGFEADQIIWDDAVYAAYTVSLLHTLNAVAESKRAVMLVGHNPSMEDLLLHFCGQAIWQRHAQENGKLFTTGNVAEISFVGEWQKLAMGDANLVRLLRPNELG